MSNPRRTPDWAHRNRIALRAIVALLFFGGLYGMFMPPAASLTSGVMPYNVFHLVSGAVGLGIGLWGRRSAIAGFNFGFGLIDLWQAIAGIFDLPPAVLFALRPADHVIHLVLGAALVFVGYRGMATSVIQPPGSGATPV